MSNEPSNLDDTAFQDLQTLKDEFISNLKSVLVSRNKSELQAELRKLGGKGTGDKAILIDRIINIRVRQWLDSNTRDNDNCESGASVSRSSRDSSTSNVDITQIMLTMMQQQQRYEEERREERQRQEEERREERRRFDQIMLEMKKSSDESQERFLMALEKQKTLHELEIRRFVEDAKKSNLEFEDVDFESIQSKFMKMFKELYELLERIDSQISDRRTYHEVEMTVERCDQIMNRLRIYHEDKVEPLSNDQNHSLIEIFERVTANFYAAIPKAKSYIHNLKKIEDEERNSGPLPPNVEIPIFYGNILSFPTFWDSFESLIHNNASVSRFYKFKYLKDAMKGTASGVIDGYELIAENYEAAFGHVQKRWGKQGATTRRFIGSLLEGNRATEDFKGLQKLLDRMRAKKTFIDKNDVHVDQLMLQIIERQLPARIEEEWIEKIVSPSIEKNETITTENLFRFLESKLNAKEVLYASRKKESKETSDRNSEHTSRRHDRQDFYTKRKTDEDKHYEFREKSTGHALVMNQKQRDATNNRKCEYCQKDHFLADCPDFQTLNEKDRLYNFHLSMRHLCSKCLRAKNQDGHPKTSYKCEHKCSIDSCQGFHHKLLHLTEKVNESNETTHATKTMLTQVRRVHNVQETSKISHFDRELGSIETILPTALAKIYKGDRSMDVRIGFDSLSHMTFFTSSLVEKMNLNTFDGDSFTVQGFGGHEYKEQNGKIVKAILGPKDEKSTQRIVIEGHIKNGDICSTLDSLNIDLNECSHLRGLDFADQFPQPEGPIDILLGARYYYQLMNGDMVFPEQSNLDVKPIAVNTIFGYVIAGPCHKQLFKNKVNNRGNFLIQKKGKSSSHQWNQLDKKLERFWECDSLGLTDQKTVHTHEEKLATEMFEHSTVFDGERYIVDLPFRPDKPRLESNYTEALRRLECTEKQLLRVPSKLETYDKAIMEYVNLGFAKQLNEEEIQDMLNQEHYFIPHHAVFKESSTSTKIRIVFDASAKDRNGYSLNDVLLQGPNLLPDIASVLLRFRMHSIAVNADIQKMFPQTKISGKHQRFQLYLWRNCDKSIKPNIFVMQRVLFGESSSPFLCISAIRKHATDNVSQYGEDFLKSIETNIYMDDVHEGGETEDEVIEKIKKMDRFFSSGGWNLTKFASNSQKVMESIPSEKRLPNLIVEFDENNFGLAGSLGLKWHTVRDTLFCNIKDSVVSQDTVVTKQSILSKLSSIYDVFGFFAAFIIRAKILMQELWESRIDWKTPITGDIENRYRKWTDEIQILETIELPRSPFRKISGKSLKSVQLHGFADASLQAYAAVFYLRTEDVNGDVEITYLMAKTRVASLKKPPIARLELLSAHSLAKLKDYIIQAISTSVHIDEIYYWLDSEIALAWIAKPSSKWKGLVKNRVQDIHDLTSISDWRHCPGKENPADLHSRGMKLSDLKHSALYWKGPAWLSNDKFSWPRSKYTSQDIEKNLPENIRVEVEKESSQKKILIVKTNDSDIEKYPNVIEKFENYNKILRVTARILRWKNKVHHGKIYDNNFIDADELSEAEKYLLRRIQQIRFPDEYSALNSEGTLSKQSKILCHDPHWDDSRRLIVGGNRLSMSNLPQETKRPILLPRKDLLVEKLILHVHTKNSHCPQDTTIALLRQKFQIIHFREEVRKALKKCLICKHANTKPLQQKMGILPEERVQVSPAFSDIGLDFAGVFYLKSRDRSSRTKAYVCIFTCTHSRMVHFELTNDMSTEEFLAALRRMMNRRGWCNTIFSDNQTSFKKADKVIRFSIANNAKIDLHDEKINKFLSDNSIKWKFITERSPHRGGFYERMNRCLKEPLRKVLGHACLNYSELYTVLTDIEASLNQRPLTYLSSDPRNLQPITPAHLAFGRTLQNFPIVNNSNSPSLTISKRYKHLQNLLVHFWKRWSAEYLPTLNSRKQWRIEQDTPKLGDVCLICEDNIPRPKWPLGRVIEIFKGRDGLVRTFRLQTEKGVFVRPIQKLHLLEEGSTSLD